MAKHSWIVGVLACGASLAIAGCAAGSSVTPTTGSAAPSAACGSGVAFAARWHLNHGENGPHYMLTRKEAREHVRCDLAVSYSNGPILTTPKVYLIFWGYKKYGDQDNVKALLEKYLANMGGSSHNEIYTQYYGISNGKTIYITNPSKQYGGAWEDDKDPVPLSPTDLQVGNEALKGVSHFGYDPSGSYVVATPHGRSSSGFGSQWCAYHSATYDDGKLVSYTNLPYVPDGGTNCGANSIGAPTDESSVDEGVTIVEGHEEAESVTDPSPPTGWYNYQYGEIADICAWQSIENDPFGSYSYTMQPIFSNKTDSCVQSY